ncbi:R8 protein [Lithohypha guttulata]|uniref:R8 protein n=1 Tax=Lithohypha guttulata TaxID=1690604 RepID=UPI002DDDEC0D|nr:R8 protein [Lithohypha guttulata]
MEWPLYGTRLVATLGSKSLLKKISRKAIMDVNVPNACDTIVDPSAPLALRLQGNLLFGVSRVFAQQCSYMLADTQGLKEKMQGINALLRELQVDPDVVTTRPHQLNLQEDPGFNIELDLGFDLSSFDTSFSVSSDPSSLMSPRTLASSQSSFLEGDELFLQEPLPLESSSSGDGAAGLNFVAEGLVDEEIQQSCSGSVNEVMLYPGPAIIEEQSLHIQEDGSLIIRDPSVHADLGQSDVIEQDVVQEQVEDFELDLHQGTTEQDGQLDPEDGHDILADNDEDADQAAVIPRAASFRDQAIPHHDEESADQTTVDRSENDPPSVDVLVGNQADDNIDTVTETAPQRRTRAVKTVTIDYPAEVPNRTIVDWNNDYLGIMDLAQLEKAERLKLPQAKRNAEYWVLDQGIGRVDSTFGEDVQDHPLAIFSGQTLLDMLVQPQSERTSRKRSSSALSSEEGDVSERRVRARQVSGQLQETPDVGDQGMADANTDANLDEDDFEPQVGRQAQAPMSDNPDIMPWNTYASSRQDSRYGSARPALSVAGFGSSARGPIAFDYMPSSVASKRVSQLIQESPLEQRRRLLRRPSLVGSGDLDSQDDDDLGGMTADDNSFDLDDHEVHRQLAATLKDITNFELQGPDTPTNIHDVPSSQLAAATLEQEAYNFLVFLQTTLETRQAGTVEDDEEEAEMTFQELLPPMNNNKIVAAQGFLHVLSLTTQGLIDVRQEGYFGEIYLSVISTPASPAPVEEEEDEEQEEG